MKNTVKILSVFLLAAFMLSLLASCAGQLSGTYRCDITSASYMTIYFTGNKYTITYYEDNAVISAFSGKYKIKDTTIEMTREFEEGTETETLAYSVNAKDRSITIGERTYYLVGNS